MPKEIICVHIGQAGAQLGHAVWEIMSIEHGIKVNGAMACDYVRRGAQHSVESFFTPLNSTRPLFEARAIFVDTDNMVIDEIRTGSYRHLFNPSFLISDYEDSCNLFPRGYKTTGKTILSPTLDAFRKISEMSDNIHGIIFFRSSGGGTGSGTTSLLMDKLEEKLSKVAIWELIVYPSPCLSNSILEPYNTVLTLFQTIRHMDITLLTGNQALYDICKRNLGIERPSYFNINRIVAHAVSSLTTSLRFDGALTSDINIFHTNLIPYPKLKFPLISFAPLLSMKKENRRPLNMAMLTKQVFNRKNFLIKCFPEYGEYMACAILYRGPGCQPREISLAVDAMRSSSFAKFVDWCPTSFKVDINYQKSPFIENSPLAQMETVVCLLANSTCVSQVFNYLIEKFDILFTSKAYVHWYTGEGLEEAEFLEARQGIMKVMSNYVENSTKEK